MVKQELRKVLVILPRKDIEEMRESEIAEGRYVTKSDFFRLAVKRLLYSEERLKNFERLRVELQKDLKKKRVSKSKISEDLDRAKKETAQRVAELLS